MILAGKKRNSKQVQNLAYLEMGELTQYSTVQYSTVQYSTVQYSAVQYSTSSKPINSVDN